MGRATSSCSSTAQLLELQQGFNLAFRPMLRELVCLAPERTVPLLPQFDALCDQLALRIFYSQQQDMVDGVIYDLANELGNFNYVLLR